MAQAPAPKPQTPLPQTVRVSTPTPTPTPPPPEAVRPVSPVENPDRYRQWVRDSVRENLEESAWVSDRIAGEVDRKFQLSFALLQTLTGLLIGLSVLGAISLWFQRRHLADRVVEEMDRKLSGQFKADLERAMVERIEGVLNDRLAANQMGQTPAQLQEMVSMALSVQNLIANARTTLEEAVRTQDRFNEQLKELSDYQLAAARSHVESGDLAEAIALYEKAGQLREYDPDIACAKGDVLLKLQQYEEAIQAYDLAIEVAPLTARAWYGKARGYALGRQGEQAIPCLQQAIDLDPQLRSAARSEPDFALIREDEWFQTTILPEASFPTSEA